MTKVPPFVSYDYQPSYVAEFNGTKRLVHASIRALGKDGTIWENFEDANCRWQGWVQIK
jgi:hypothetical protein